MLVLQIAILRNEVHGLVDDLRLRSWGHGHDCGKAGEVDDPEQVGAPADPLQGGGAKARRPPGAHALRKGDVRFPGYVARDAQRSPASSRFARGLDERRDGLANAGRRRLVFLVRSQPVHVRARVLKRRDLVPEPRVVRQTVFEDETDPHARKRRRSSCWILQGVRHVTGQEMRLARPCQNGAIERGQCVEIAIVAVLPGREIPPQTSSPRRLLGSIPQLVQGIAQGHRSHAP